MHEIDVVLARAGRSSAAVLVLVVELEAEAGAGEEPLMVPPTDGREDEYEDKNELVNPNPDPS